jgi:hypothetical protein
MVEARQLAIRLDPELREVLDRQAAAEGISLSALVRRTLWVTRGSVIPGDLRRAADRLEALQSKEGKK